MKPGQASRTAVIVCMGRALAHGRTPVARFHDPTALALLPDDARAHVEALRAGRRPASVRARVAAGALAGQSRVMVPRTVAIDEAVRAAPTPQLVILGAGLDGRAWRMPELRDVVVFEVDHPDSQRDKRARAAALAPTARDLRFVPVDFTRDSLDAALAAAGHDPARPTTWIWEGVVMYLTPAEVDATLAVVARRSTAASRLVVLYHGRQLMGRLVGLVTRRLGEPLRSAYTPAAIAAVLARHGFAVGRDADMASIAAALGAGFGLAAWTARHLRVAVADRPERRATNNRRCS